MPRRRRVQEAKRRFARELTQAEREAEVEVESLRLRYFADPLDDVFWRSHEDPCSECCPCCRPMCRCPRMVEAAAREEINEHLKGKGTERGDECGEGQGRSAGAG